MDHRDRPGQNGELEYYTNDDNAAMDGAGDLVIEARREVTAGSSCPGGPCQYTSGRINTCGKFSFTYGHVEARIKVSGTQGLWPAFWMLGANFPPSAGPASAGEIDIMEHVGRVPHQVFSTLHAPAYNGGGGFGSPYTITGDFAAAFHTTRGLGRLAHDVLRRRQPVLHADQGARSRRPAGRGSTTTRSSSSSTTPSAATAPAPRTPPPCCRRRMLVDYVRVFQ